MARFGLFDRNICQCRKQSRSLRYLSTKRLGAATKIRRLTFSLESMFSELPKFSMCECLARHRKRDQLGCMLGRHTPAERLARGGENAVDLLDKAKCGIVACRCPLIYCFDLSDSNVSQCCQQHCSLRPRPTRNLGVATKRRIFFGLKSLFPSWRLSCCASAVPEIARETNWGARSDDTPQPKGLLIEDALRLTVLIKASAKSSPVSAVG